MHEELLYIKQIQQLKQEVAALKESGPFGIAGDPEPQRNWMNPGRPERDQRGYTPRMKIQDLEKEVRMLTAQVAELEEELRATRMEI